MNVQRGRIVSGGRVQLPADVRRQLSLRDGDTIYIEVVDGEVHLRPANAVIKRIQDLVQPYIVEGVSVVDELIADRRREAADE
jgi:AbrB family looped-hinge helix DNA binding protein